jgi:hypothetical protein
VIAEAVASGYSVIVLFVSSKSLLSLLVVILDVVINEFFSKMIYIYIYILKKKKLDSGIICTINFVL